MSCSYPRRAFDTGYLTDKNKPLYVITDNKTNFIYKPVSRESVLNNTNKYECYEDIIINSYKEISCGECEHCLADKAQELASNCIAEAKCYEHNYVINLTYDDAHVPTAFQMKYDETQKIWEPVVNELTGEVLTSLTLSYPDVQKFLKNVRRYYEYHYNFKKLVDDNGNVINPGIRFCCAGEYGEKYHRPHYHIMMFNFPIYDLKFRGYTDNGSLEYTSETIQKLWGKGFVTIGECNRESIQYVANYCLKKIKGSLSEQHYNKLGIVPEFVERSRKPSLGAYYYDGVFCDYLMDGKFYLSTSSGTITMSKCEYLDKKIEAQNPQEYERLKAARQALAETRERTRAMLSGVTIEEQRQNDANAFHDKIKHAKHRTTI